MENEIFLTKEAVVYIKSKIEDNKYFRIAIKSGGCHGFSYWFDFDNEIKSKDLQFQFDGLNVIIDKKSIQYLNGATLDYEDTLLNKNLFFKNPNETSSCGCKNSFSI